MARTSHPAGKRDNLIAFEKRTEVDDGYGNTVAGDFEFQFEQYAEVIFLKGGESVIAARLESRQPAVISVLASVQMQAVTNDWRARDTRSETLFNIRSITQTPNRAYFELLCETGVNEG